MSFRTKVFLSITTTVVISVWIVASVVSTLVTNSFERQDMQRTATLVSQFHSEFERRSAEVARRVDAIANSEDVQRLAVNLGASKIDAAQYYDEAQALAKEQSLNFLELVGPDDSLSPAVGRVQLLRNRGGLRQVGRGRREHEVRPERSGRVPHGPPLLPPRG